MKGTDRGSTRDRTSLYSQVSSLSWTSRARLLKDEVLSCEHNEVLLTCGGSADVQLIHAKLVADPRSWSLGPVSTHLNFEQ